MYKGMIICVGLLLNAQSFAQDWSQLDADQLGGIANQALAMKGCLEDIDDAALEGLQEEAMGVQKKIERLCNQGNRARAQSIAIEFGRKLVAEPTVKQLQECAGLADGTIPQTAWAQLEDSEQVRKHVCDM